MPTTNSVRPDFIAEVTDALAAARKERDEFRAQVRRLEDELTVTRHRVDIAVAELDEERRKK